MQILYNIAAIIVVILIIPVFMVRAIRERGFVERIKQSLGFISDEELAKVAKKNCIWVHAASVGEVVAASPLIKEFRKEFPTNPILVSVVTASGYEMANRIIKDADSIIYFPLDLPFLAAHMVRRILPRVYLPVETELWPNFLKACRKLRIPVMMVNGRISDKSVRRYHHLHSLLDDMIGTVTKFAMQSPIDAEHIIRLGANPNLVIVTGNTKFDQTYTNVSKSEKNKILRDMGLTDNDGIFLAGSTHRGEEEPVLKAFEAIRETHKNAKLVIAPRELLRVSEVIFLCENAGFKVAKRTELSEHPSTGHDIVILDTIGELGKVYSIGDVIYVGGSLIPHGGHNILEPAAHGKAIIVGFNMFNFKETHALFTKRNAVITARNADELVESVKSLFDDPDERMRMESETLAICEENKGAARKSAMLLHEMLDQVEEKRLASGIIKSTDKIENFQTYFFQLIHSKEAHGFFESVVIAVLYIFSIIYRALVNLKLLGFKVGAFSKKRLGMYVISLGNITVGGTGKTPTAQRLAHEIHEMGYRVVILNRGYRAKWDGDVGIVSDGIRVHLSPEEAGDEAYMLAKHLPDVPVLIGTDRYVTGNYAIKNFGAEVAILDDGYQHWQLERDMDILLVDAVNVFGNGYMLPRGTLREPISHIDRADVCLVTKVDQASDASRAYIRKIVREENNHALIVESIHHPKGFIELSDWNRNIKSVGIDIRELEGKRVMALSAIGNPASFEQTIADLGIIVVESLRFPDHHDYLVDEIFDATSQAINLEADAIVITEKDAVKMPMPPFKRDNKIIESFGPIPIYVLGVEVSFGDGAGEFWDMLKSNLKENIGKKKGNE
ncbi:MAG: tetraacyldisaccharide 4'-kinase [Schwartzia sp.]|nr:tetraacyldisaccharide 4'-kinase [Schwartzia sp. (in: firmicutes)]